MRFKEKVCVVTGGSSGIGAAAVRKFFSEGGKVHNFDLNPPLRGSRESESVFHKCDVSNLKNITSCVDEVIQKDQKIDVLFANAGIHFSGTIEDTDIETMNRVVGVNLFGVFFTLKGILPFMVKQKSGTIVITCSDQSLVGKGRSAIYGATKGAVAQLVKSTALDYATYNIRVNGVCPASIQTPLYEQAIGNAAKKYFKGETGELKKRDTAEHPLGRIGTPDEVANLVGFLASDESGFITGSLHLIDGGLTAG